MLNFFFKLLGLWVLLIPLPAFAHEGIHEQLQQADQKIEESPDDVMLYWQRGITHSQAGNQDLAIADYERAAALGDPALVAYDAGISYYLKGEYAQDLHYFDMYLQRSPEHAPSYEYRARVYRDSGQLALAVADMRKYFELAEQPNPGNYIAAADMLLALNPPATEQALAILDGGLEQLGIVPQIQRYAIKIETESGNYEAAIVRLESLASVLHTSVQWQVDMAELLVLAKRDSEAKPYLIAAKERLNTLRKTPARLVLLSRIDAIETSLPSE